MKDEDIYDSVKILRSDGKLNLNCRLAGNCAFSRTKWKCSIQGCTDVSKSVSESVFLSVVISINKKTKKSTDRNKGVVKKLVNEIINLYLISNLLK